MGRGGMDVAIYGFGAAPSLVPQTRPYTYTRANTYTHTHTIPYIHRGAESRSRPVPMHQGIICILFLCLCSVLPYLLGDVRSDLAFYTALSPRPDRRSTVLLAGTYVLRLVAMCRVHLVLLLPYNDSLPVSPPSSVSSVPVSNSTSLRTSCIEGTQLMVTYTPFGLWKVSYFPP